MIAAELYLDHPALCGPLQQSPEASVTWERSDIVGPETLRLLFWVETQHAASLEAAFEQDPSVTKLRRVIELDDRQLYSVDQQGEDIKADAYQRLVDQGCVIRNAVVDHDGWIIQVAYPDRESLAEFLDYCENRDIEFELRRLLTEDDSSVASGEFGLTPRQSEILEAAVREGYFEIPRDASLAELGDAVGISGNAASERLRRAMNALVQNTILDARSGENAASD